MTECFSDSSGAAPKWNHHDNHDSESTSNSLALSHTFMFESPETYVLTSLRERPARTHAPRSTIPPPAARRKAGSLSILARSRSGYVVIHVMNADSGGSLGSVHLPVSMIERTETTQWVRLWQPEITSTGKQLTVAERGVELLDFDPHVARHARNPIFSARAI